MTKKPTAGMIHNDDVTSTFEQKAFNIIREMQCMNTIYFFLHK